LIGIIVLSKLVGLVKGYSFSQGTPRLGRKRL